MFGQKSAAADVTQKFGACTQAPAYSLWVSPIKVAVFIRQVLFYFLHYSVLCANCQTFCRYFFRKPGRRRLFGRVTWFSLQKRCQAASHLSYINIRAANVYVCEECHREGANECCCANVNQNTVK